MSPTMFLANTNAALLDIVSYTGFLVLSGWTLSIHLYFMVRIRKQDVPKSELKKVAPASLGESVQGSTQ